MDRERALALARQFAEARRWEWREPVRVMPFRRWWIGPLRWRVRTHAGARGLNVWIEIDDRDELIVKARYIPR